MIQGESRIFLREDEGRIFFFFFLVCACVCCVCVRVCVCVILQRNSKCSDKTQQKGPLSLYLEPMRYQCLKRSLQNIA